MGIVKPAKEDSLSKYFSLFKRRRLLVLGDVMIDRYIVGDVARISPEAPIPVLHGRSSRALLGGAGNVARNAASLGAAAVLIGSVGNDAAGREVHAILSETPGVTGSLIDLPGRTTTVKTRFMSGAHQLLRWDEEDQGLISPDEESRILQLFEAALPTSDIVVISDYAKGLLTDAVLAGAIRLARDAGRIVVTDPKRPRFGAYSGTTILTPNMLEVSRATDIACVDDVGAQAAGLAALHQAQATAVLLKRSDKGLTLVTRDDPPVHLRAEAREVADVSGAGDTLVTACALMLACGAPLQAAAALANVAAGVVVGKIGTATISQRELWDALHSKGHLAMDRKVVMLDAAIGQTAVWRASGMRVGFTNGCFDLVHPGHVRMLARARQSCDRLIVALNTDASVARLKGPNRPVQQEMSRATVIASLAAVDLVLLFDEDTPYDLIEAIRPDVLFKGADYRADQVVGAKIVESYGGAVELIPLEYGHSTTKTISRIAALT